MEICLFSLMENIAWLKCVCVVVVVLLCGANGLNWEADVLVLSLLLDQFVPVVYVQNYCKQWVILISIDLSVQMRDFQKASHFAGNNEHTIIHGAVRPL